MKRNPVLVDAQTGMFHSQPIAHFAMRNTNKMVECRCTYAKCMKNENENEIQLH